MFAATPFSPQQGSPEPFWAATFQDPIATFTFFLVVATVGLWVSTLLLWLSTRKLARDTKESGIAQADKMERSAAAMEGVAESMKVNAREIVRSVDLQRRYGQMQLRPYLTVLVGEGLWQDDNLNFEIRPKVLNTGHTPAKDVRWRIGIEVLSPENFDTFRFPLPEAVGGNMIAPHQDYLLSAVLPRRVGAADAIRDGDASKGIIVVYGCISYRDSLKRRYLTTFAQQVSWQLEKGWRGKIKSARLRGRFLYRHNRAN
jgi:hypothetical protein